MANEANFRKQSGYPRVWTQPTHHHGERATRPENSPMERLIRLYKIPQARTATHRGRHRESVTSSCGQHQGTIQKIPISPDQGGPITPQIAIPVRFIVYRLSRPICWLGFILSLSVADLVLDESVFARVEHGDCAGAAWKVVLTIFYSRVVSTSLLVASSW